MALLGIEDATRILNLRFTMLWAINIVLREFRRWRHVIFVKAVEHGTSPMHPVTLFIPTYFEQQYGH